MTAKGMTRRSALAALAATAAAPAIAQGGRAVTMMHGFPAGTNVDVVARLVADSLGPRLGQTIIIDPRPGAGGTIGAAAIARAPADGSALAIVAGGHAIAAALYNQLPYDPVEDFTFISMVQDFPFVLVTHPGHPAKSLADVIQRAQAEPGKLSCATGGNGTGMHLAFELFTAMAGIKIQHIPYRGTPQAYADLVEGRIDFMVSPPSAVVSHIRNGTLRALAVTGPDRFFKLPDVPAIGESVKDYRVTSWIGVAGPARLPEPLVSRINTELKAILADPETGQRLREMEGDPQWTSPQDFKTRVVEDVAKWTKVVRDANIPKI